MQSGSSSSVLLESPASSDRKVRLDSEERLAALRDLEVLDTPIERNFQLLAELSNSLLETPVSLITLVTDTRQFFVSSDGLQEPWSSRRETPLSHSFCQHVVYRNEPLVVSDSRSHELVCENFAVDELGVSAYLGVPLVHNDQVVGSFCAIDGSPREWRKGDLESLYKLASLAASELINRKIANQKMFELESRLQQSQKMEAIGRLTTGVAHDFSNILWAIQLSTSLLEKNRQDGVMARAHADNVYASVNAARGIIGQLLNWGRPGNHAASDVALSQIVSQALPLLRRSLLSATDIQFESHDPGWVFADVDQIYQVLMNLCSNADHAMSAKGGEVVMAVATKNFDSEAAAEFGMEPGQYVELSIADQGHGIEPDILHRIHDPYFTTKPVGEGSGLGLWTVFGIVHRHDGQIRVESTPGHGTTFRIIFPARQENERVDSGVTKSQTLIDSHKKTVLVVCEDAELASAMQQRLPSNTVSIVGFDRSSDAFEYFIRNASQVDVLVVDQAMPILAGDELAKRCKLTNPSLSVVVCGSNRVGKSCDQEPDAVVYCEKPVDHDELAAIVAEQPKGHAKG